MFKTSTLYSIGHGHKSKEEFLAELKSFGIKYLVDVRTMPYSKWASDFNGGCIEKWLVAAGVRYVYMGDSIGGKPQDNTCYDAEGFFDYRKMAEVPSFREGLNRLVVANNKGLLLAVMCTETDPSQCHRSKLIGRELYFNYEINMRHIVGIGKSISQEAIMRTLGDWEPNGNLFGSYEPPYFKSCKAYKEISQYAEDYYD